MHGWWTLPFLLLDLQAVLGVAIIRSHKHQCNIARGLSHESGLQKSCDCLAVDLSEPWARTLITNADPDRCWDDFDRSPD